VTPVSLSRSLLALAALLPAALGAQRGDKRPGIPVAYKPPAGMCRIWVDGVPPDKQPAPTDCSAALKNKPANGRVVFGESATSTKGGTQALMHRALVPPLRGATATSGSRVPRDSGSVIRATSKPGRDTSKIGRDSTVRKPPPPAC
jgi:hypothetical protein